MDIQVLRDAKKGYKKDDVMLKLDKLNLLYARAQEGKISKSDALERAQQIADTPIKTAFFNGFNKEDTDNYISEILDMFAAL